MKNAQRPRPSADRASINRANSQFSTGPKTAEGRAKSSRNSFDHGLYSAAIVLDSERLEDFDALSEDFLSEYQPATPTERALVEELVQNHWRVLRFRRHESATLNVSTAPYSDNQLLNIQRLMTSAERSFQRALKELQALQKQRGFVSQNAAPQHEEAVADPPTAAPEASPKCAVVVMPARTEPPPPVAAEPQTNPQAFEEDHRIERRALELRESNKRLAAAPSAASSTDF